MSNQKFYKSFNTDRWFSDVSDYIQLRRLSIQQRFEDTFRYVSIDTTNSKTFSAEYASILRDSCSVFDTSLNESIKEIKGEKESGYYTILDYQKLVREYEPQVGRQYVVMQIGSKYFNIFPLYCFSDDKIPPWWKAYNNIKHSEYKFLKMGSLENACTSIAALVLLESFFLAARTNQLWVAIGLADQENSPDLKESRLIFVDAWR